MSERARKFVESWIEEYLHPSEPEDSNRHSQSRADAVACVESAEIEGISRDEIRHEFDDLVSYMIARRQEAVARAHRERRPF